MRPINKKKLITRFFSSKGKGKNNNASENYRERKREKNVTRKLNKNWKSLKNKKPKKMLYLKHKRKSRLDLKNLQKKRSRTRFAEVYRK